MSRDRFAELNSSNSNSSYSQRGSSSRGDQRGNNYVPLRETGNSYENRNNNGYGGGRSQSNNYDRQDNFGRSYDNAPRLPPPAAIRNPQSSSVASGGGRYDSGGGGRGGSSRYGDNGGGRGDGNSYELTQRRHAPNVDIPPAPASTTGSMDVFFNEITVINNLLKQAKASVEKIEGFQSRTLDSDPYGDDRANKNAHRQLDTTTEEVRIIMNALKERIKAIELENAQLPKSHPNSAMRTSQFGQIKKKFLDFILVYNEVEREHSAKVKERMERSIRVVNPNMTDDEIRDELDRQVEGGGVFAQSMVNQGGRYTSAQSALEEVQNRNNDIQKIEKTIIQLAEMFAEMSTLVEAQGQIINTIEEHAQNTETYTERAAVELNTAVVTAKKTRKRKWTLLCCCLLLFIIGGFALYWFVLSPEFGLPGNPKPAAPAAAAPAAAPATGSGRVRASKKVA